MALAQKQIQDQKQTSVFRHVLAAVDFSPASKRALAEALALTASNDAQLSVVHVLQTDWRYEMLENPPEIELERIDVHRRLQKLIDELSPEQKIDSILVRHGPVARAILSVAVDSGADLIVVGTHGRGGFSKFALGSVAEELLRIAPCPVMTIGPKTNPEKPLQRIAFHTILFATDFGVGSIKALPFALKLARTYDAKLVLVHMIPPMPATSVSLSAYAPANAAADELQEWEVACRKRALQQLKECVPPDIALEREPEYVVGTDFLAEGALTAAARFKVDLIVMGANRAGSARVAAHVPWTAVHEVLANAPCPVLTVAE
jgi:nucleotide-binding universal stress UspA family protein